MEIIDNFLEQKDFDELQTIIMGSEFNWVYRTTIDYENDVDKYQFIHGFYEKCFPISPVIEILNPIINTIDVYALLRIKANLLTRTPDIIKNQFHTDTGGMSEEKLKQWTTSIFYVNTNNGYTEFEDGTKIDSVANRLVTFSTNLKHRGTTCTDQKKRVVINFNYFSRYS